MASLTIRKLDETIKASLRLRSAKNGRSVEEEVRVILGELLQGRPEFTAAPPKAESPTAERRVPTQGGADATDRPRVTLIIGGGIAAYKALDLIRRLKERHIHVRCVLTKAGQQFVTPLAASALSDERCYTDLFDPESEFDAGHIRLARDCDLIVVAPATADLMSKMAQGAADDQGDPGLTGRIGAPHHGRLGIRRRQDGLRRCCGELGAALYKLPEDHPDLLFDGAAVFGRAQPQIGLDGFVEFSDGQASHGVPD